MDSNARESYLEAQILTATPQKLRLMLIDGAIRFARQTLRSWAEAKQEEAIVSLVRCRAIVTELLSSIRPDKTPFTQKVTGVYVFLFQALADAQLRRDPRRVEEIIEVLEIDRETWRQVCEQMPDRPVDPEGRGRPAEISSSEAVLRLAGASSFGETPQGGLVLDA